MVMLKSVETRYRPGRCLPDFLSLSSDRMASPPKNIAKGPLVRKGCFPDNIWILLCISLD